MKISALLVAGMMAGIGMSAPSRAATIADQSISIPSIIGKPQPASRVLRLTGMIEEGDAARLRAILTGMGKKGLQDAGAPLATIEMSSAGGDLLEGLKLGYLFREFDVATLVRARDSCLSACALAFLGGTASHRRTEVVTARTIEVGAILGFHNFALNPNHPTASAASSPREGIAKGFNEAQGAAALFVHYVGAMGVDSPFIARMLGRPPQVWEYVDTAEKFLELKICPAGVLRPLPAPAARALNICSNLMHSPAQVVPPHARRLPAAEAKRRLLEHVQRNVSALNMNGLLAAQLAAVVASRDERLLNSVYADLRAAGLPLPEIVGPTFEVTGFESEPYRLQCTVSLSLDDPDKFDAVIQEPAALSKPDRRITPACSRLLGYEPGEKLNPLRE
ncbi:MAG TPA: hypothetical protein VFB13_22425 [Reyranella sp.]|nr:hypothetical protein [Reyranella sp.]